jgi:hypothetical protein
MELGPGRVNSEVVDAGQNVVSALLALAVFTSRRA